jgi:hypothetical protein
VVGGRGKRGREGIRALGLPLQSSWPGTTQTGGSRCGRACRRGPCRQRACTWHSQGGRRCRRGRGPADKMKTGLGATSATICLPSAHGDRGSCRASLIDVRLCRSLFAKRALLFLPARRATLPRSRYASRQQCLRGAQCRSAVYVS